MSYNKTWKSSYYSYHIFTCVCRRVLTSHCWGAEPQPWISPKDQTHLETPVGGVGIETSTFKQRRTCDHTKTTQSFYFLLVPLMSSVPLYQVIFCYLYFVR